MKWILIGLGAFVLYQVIRNNQTSHSGGGLLSGGSSGGSGATGLVNSLTGLTNAVGKLFGGGSSSVTDRDGLMRPTF